MPTYDYRCTFCGHRLAAFQGITEDPLTNCPKCRKEGLRRLIGAGAGIIFKGSGFYETDYKRSRRSPTGGGDAGSKKEAAAPDSKGAKPKGGSEGGSGGKPGGGSD